jgi:nitrite reductase/ring-hydroxylating ferredoxin subunit
MFIYISDDQSGSGAVALALASRRRFIQWLSLGAVCATGDLFEQSLRAASGGGGTAMAGALHLNLDQYPALKNEGGSVVAKVAGMPASFPQIVVTRLANNEFAAVTSKCTHMGCTVQPFNPVAGYIACNCHGSRFTATGAVTRGPALQALTQYGATFDGGSIVTIQIPGLGFAVAISPAAAADRWLLAFPTVTGVKYDVRFKAALTEGAWQVVPFSTTVSGDLTQTVLSGNNAQASVYVSRSAESGFLAVTRF